MATTFVKIQTVTVGAGGAANIDFTNIPQTFNDLLVKISLRTDRGVAFDALDYTFNNTSSNRNYRELYGNGASTVSGNSTGGLAGYIPAASATGSVFGNSEIYIPNYTRSVVKSSSADSAGETNATTAYTHLIANLWSDTAAITRITLSSAYSATLVQYTTATLYGIKSS